MGHRLGGLVGAIAAIAIAPHAYAQGAEPPSSTPPASDATTSDTTATNGASSSDEAAPPPPTDPASSSTPSTDESARPDEVRVHGDATRLDQKRRSAEAIDVIDTSRARQQSGDIGELISRSMGVTVQRTAGLGSTSRLSLNGLTDDQIRFFLDGVPLEFMGFANGISNVPVNMVRTIEIYRGVVPIRFGADALGGAVNLVTDQQPRGTRVGASYQAGSFGTYRLAANARHGFDTGGWFVSAAVFGDRARNDYPVEVAVPDGVGTPRPTTVRRFHDGYQAGGAYIEAGVADRAWAKRLSLRVFATNFTKDLQHNVNMTVPYGEIESGETIYGSTVQYDKDGFITKRLRLQTLAGYSRRDIRFRDASPWVYDWYGRRVFQRRTPVGELGSAASDADYWEDRVLGRLMLGHPIAEGQALRVSVAPTFVSRSGRENLRPPNVTTLDKASADQRMTLLVTGAEYQLDAFEGVLENIAFVKDYLYAADAQDLSNDKRSFQPVTKNVHTVGAGNGLRVKIGEIAWAKASYEYATRLPRTDEVFGDGVAILPNLDLKQEKSHNLNVGVTLDAKETAWGAFRGDVMGFLRQADDLIIFVPLARDAFSTYDNVSKVRSVGVQGGAGWTSPGNYLWLDGNATWMDFRNESESGLFAPYRGDRVPNRPWLFASASARLQFAGVQMKNDELSFGWDMRYVHSFFPSWESVGQRQTKVFVPQQITHTARITYAIHSKVTITSSVEVQNLTDARVYDVLAVQKPGRAFYFKGTIEY